MAQDIDDAEGDFVVAGGGVLVLDMFDIESVVGGEICDPPPGGMEMSMAKPLTKEFMFPSQFLSCLILNPDLKSGRSPTPHHTTSGSALLVISLVRGSKSGRFL